MIYRYIVRTPKRIHKSINRLSFKRIILIITHPLFLLRACYVVWLCTFVSLYQSVVLQSVHLVLRVFCRRYLFHLFIDVMFFVLLISSTGYLSAYLIWEECIPGEPCERNWNDTKRNIRVRSIVGISMFDQNNHNQRRVKPFLKYRRTCIFYISCTVTFWIWQVIFIFWAHFFSKQGWMMLHVLAFLICTCKIVRTA